MTKPTTPAPAAPPAAPAAPVTTPAAPAAPAAAAPAASPAPPAVPTSAPSALSDPPAEKPAETPAAKPGDAAPKALELKLPEGFEVDAAALKGFELVATELGLDTAKAQKVFDQFVGFQQAQQKQADTALAAQDAKWVDELKADPELQLGGAKWPEAKKAIERAKAHFPDAKGAVEVLNAAGLGNHPSVVRLFAAIGRSLKEDRVAGTTTPPAVKDERPSDATVFFPTKPA